MSLPQTSKEKSARVDWGYHARPSPTARTRRRLWALALVFVAAPAVAATVAAGLSEKVRAPLAGAASRGPLASPHAAWDTRCEACHEPFQPINGDPWLARTLGLGTSPADAAHPTSVANARCESCHAGGPHHPNAPTQLVVGCAECHRDHRGRDVSLVNLADATCTRCHADLQQHHTDPAGIHVASASITNFATNHPEFRQVSEPKAIKRTLKFSHGVHMAPGFGVGSGSRFKDIPDQKAAARYMALAGETDVNASARLECAACHQLDAGRTDAATAPITPDEKYAAALRGDLHGLPKEPIQPPRAAGAYFLPIEFDAHCKACHPLSFDESPGLRDRRAPHRAQPDEIERFLTEVYSARYVADKLKPAGPDRGDLRLDNRPADLDKSGKDEARRQIDAEVEKAKRVLFAGKKACRECHYTEGDPASPTKVLPSVIPTIWQTKAMYNHSAHRSVACNQCHEGAYRKPADEMTLALKYGGEGYQHTPDLPSIDNCRQCHSPARTEELGKAFGGVRHGCTDCHSYHHANHRLAGPGSSLRNPAATASLDEFLRGRPGGK